MDEIFTKIAKENNTTKKQVEREISKAIDIAIKNSKENKEAKKFWDEMMQNGDKPDAEIVIKKIAEKIMENKNKL